MIWQYYESQFIFCMLYVEKVGVEKIFENVYIVCCDLEGDQFWIGFSELVIDINIVVRLLEIWDQLYEDILDCIDIVCKKIFDIKDDNYLFCYDIDEIFDGS